MGLRWDEINVFYNSDEWTVRHEFGHALGLDHDDDNPESLMFPTRSGRAPKIDVEQQDLEFIRSQLTCH
jgi:predicted Zn-dependent protease